MIFDRYYASHYLFSVLLHKKVHFLFRMRDHSWKCVQSFIASGLKEEVVELNVYPYSKVAKKIPANVGKTIQVRLVKQVTRSGEIRVYATSLLDKEVYSRTAIINLYKQRWGIEEAYKTLKARLDVIHFSGKTVKAVQQDFYANVFLITLASVLKADIKPSLKRKKRTH
jgi:IS4 transposase